jgi:biotin carboxyl carrier protein
MHGTVIAIAVQAGDSVSEGQRVVVLEAMKMENEIHAHTGGTVQTVAVEVGDTVDDGQVLMEII